MVQYTLLPQRPIACFQAKVFVWPKDVSGAFTLYSNSRAYLQHRSEESAWHVRYKLRYIDSSHSLIVNKTTKSENDNGAESSVSDEKWLEQYFNLGLFTESHLQLIQTDSSHSNSELLSAWASQKTCTWSAWWRNGYSTHYSAEGPRFESRSVRF